jgi:site-specific DNA-methyltransferase (adenine-specific)
LKNTIHNGDCLELMKLIPDGSVDMILCDLPYGTTACKWDVIIPFEPLWEQYERVIKSNGAIILFATQPFTTELIVSNKNLFKYDMVWSKDKPADFGNGNIKPLRYHETICIFYKKTPIYNKQFESRKGSGYARAKYPVNYINNSDHKFGMKNGSFEYANKDRMIGTVIDITTGARGSIKHPTVKPVKLFEHLIKTYTNEGETVLDNCAGSGTTAIACLNTNRNYILMEKEEKYFEMITNRIAKWHSEREPQGLFKTAI